MIRRNFHTTSLLSAASFAALITVTAWAENGPPVKTATDSTQPTASVLTKVTLGIDEANMLGLKNAPLTMVEYSDVQCSFCRRFHDRAFSEIRKHYIDTGKLRFVARDLPLPFHAHAMPAAIASRCAGEQDHFWEMRETLISNSDKLAQQDIQGYAGSLGLDTDAFSSCVNSGKFNNAIEKDRSEARGLNVTGTPSFLIGRTTSEGVEGSLVVGALPYESFVEAFRALEASLSEEAH